MSFISGAACINVVNGGMVQDNRSCHENSGVTQIYNETKHPRSADKGGSV